MFSGKFLIVNQNRFIKDKVEAFGPTEVENEIFIAIEGRESCFYTMVDDVEIYLDNLTKLLNGDEARKTPVKRGINGSF